MKSGSMLLIVLVAIIAIGGCGACNVQRSLVTLDENTKAKWADVQTQYQRRSDLIPNLVNTVKGVANFEQKTLTDVIEARAMATQVTINANDLSPEKIQQFQQAQGQLSQSLGRLLAVAESYPTLRATENFSQLQSQIESTENRIATSRKYFNDAVQQYNVKERQFPNNFFAGMMGFKEKGMFSADPGADKAPSVDFGK